MRIGRVWKLYFVFTVVLIVTMTLAGFVLQFLINKRLTMYLKKDAMVLVRTIAKILPETENIPILDEFCRDYRQTKGVRITIIKKDGKVIGDSDRESTGMENHSYRPEIQRAIKEGTGMAIRFSETLRMEMLYVALFTKEKNKAIRVAVPMEEVKKAKNEVMFFLSIGLYLTPILAIIISFIFVRYMSPEPNKLTGKLN